MYFGFSGRKYKKTFTELDIYNYYCKSVKKPLSRKEFSQVSKDIGEAIMRLVIYNNYIYYMPYRLGDISLKRISEKVSYDDNGQVNTNKLPIDWGRTTKYWAEIYKDLTTDEIKQIKDKKVFYHLNEDVDGQRAYFRWSKVTSNFKNKNMYLFRPVRKFSRELAVFIKYTKKLNYYE